MSALNTPGPWIAQPDPDDCGYGWVVGTADGSIDAVATCSQRDALLIAAAPEMLDALIAVNWAAEQNFTEALSGLGINAIRQMRRAIKKATEA